MGDVVDELGHSLLCRIIDAVILGEVGQVLGVCARIFGGLSELQKLMHELEGNELPLNVESEAHLIDPPVQPRTTIGGIEFSRLELELKLWVILCEEEVLACIIKTADVCHCTVIR